MQREKVFIWGGKGQAKVLAPIIKALGLQLSVVYDQNPKLNAPFPDITFINQESELKRYLAQINPAEYYIVPAIGAQNKARLTIVENMQKLGMQALTLIHPQAIVAKSAIIGLGAQILAAAVISEEVVLAEQVIINTSAIIDHETRVGKACHIMPAATITGEVVIEDYVTIGSNATILPRLTIGANAIVGAGAVVTTNVTPGSTVAGIPAKALVKG